MKPVAIAVLLASGLTVVAGPVASAGILSDSVPLSSLTGPLSYALHEESLSDPG